MPIVVPEQATGRLTDAWRACVGTGRFDLALRRDYQDSLSLVQREIGFRHIRGHGLFSDGTGIYRPYEYRGSRQVRYAFTYVDQVIDAYLALGVRPFLELGFMPTDLAAGDQTVFWWRGNVTPPRSWTGWADLVRATLRHLVDRYGLDEVRGWPIEVWNEPNLTQFWRDADRDAYHRLYEVTAHAVKEVDAGLQVGGPAISPGADDWLMPFAEFVTARSVPVDFVSKHAYTSGPAQHVPFGTHQPLAPGSELLAQFAAPRRLLRGTALADLPVHITEFNSSYRPDNPVHDTAFHAAYLAPVLAGGGDLVDSFSYWTFSDMFEEEGVPTTLFHGGFGLLTHRQIKKPTYHLYAFMARLGDEVLARGSDHLVTRDATGRIAVLAWAPVDATGDTPGPDRHTVRLSLPLRTPGGAAFLLRSSVDEEVGNAWTAWCEMGRPHSPTARQLDQLREAAEPARRHARLPVEGGRVTLDLHLSRHEVTLAELTAATDETPPWWDDDRLLGRAADDGPPRDAGPDQEAR
ncbi:MULTISPECIES: xylan 1,4-beta-xylosidase [Micromonospora]|uniref:Xylan 1,4-beta-xylosidase n=1 Tax=Micromonospora solifontis TaxID=2487138 RepID=A0ABX9WFT7_9ACTN|nr:MULTISPECIES: xylan 1,4-beta-xylosidase [Micromonospora]NES13826.1 xylan 1,4-beta-xylosidase [Micromonospora sp. PPF5-17B]NES37082.1 xylan 1,4-beta-xylosidase [Micromonospora solifontis]NES58343.1 xylan 1,4-beta-xylosidase [Micromonospora sp. PPF5-6]RNL98752.1 xylan 1,4-beta-xylosidase [Micromonospora solifontis]